MTYDQAMKKAEALNNTVMGLQKQYDVFLMANKKFEVIHLPTGKVEGQDLFINK